MTQLLRWSGSIVPSSLVTKSNTAHILFTSDDTGVRTGFQLQWEAYPKGNSCFMYNLDYLILDYSHNIVF